MTTTGKREEQTGYTGTEKIEHDTAGTGLARELQGKLEAEGQAAEKLTDLSWVQAPKDGSGRGSGLKGVCDDFAKALREDDSWRHTEMLDAAGETARLLTEPLRDRLQELLGLDSGPEHKGNLDNLYDMTRIQDTPEVVSGMLGRVEARLVEELTHRGFADLGVVPDEGLAETGRMLEGVARDIDTLDTEGRTPTCAELIDAVNPFLAGTLFSLDDRREPWDHIGFSADDRYVMGAALERMAGSWSEVNVERSREQLAFAAASGSRNAFNDAVSAQGGETPGFAGDREDVSDMLFEVGYQALVELEEWTLHRLGGPWTAESPEGQNLTSFIRDLRDSVLEGVVVDTPDWAGGQLQAQLAEVRAQADARGLRMAGEFRSANAALDPADAEAVQAAWLDTLTKGDRDRVAAAMSTPGNRTTAEAGTITAVDYQGEDFNLRRALRELQDLEHRRSGRLTGDVVDHCFRTDRDDPTAHFQAALEGLAPMDRERVDAALIAAAPDGADTGALFGTAREVASTWRRDAHEREFPQARRDREAREAAAAAAD